MKEKLFSEECLSNQKMLREETPLSEQKEEEKREKEPEWKSRRRNDAEEERRAIKCSE